MKTFNPFLLSGVAVAAMIGCAAPAMAQDSAPADEFANDEIIVTAQKREQGIQDVPISMEVVSGDTIEEMGVNDFADMASYVPNVAVQTTAGNDVIYIRGFGSPPANFSFDQAVSLYIDGVYAGRSRQTQAPFFDIARVEVLRGPQGALFGKNTAAGAISVVSAAPTRDLEAALVGSYDFEYDGFQVSGHVSGPISDTLSVRLAGRVVDNNGYILNRATGQKNPQTKQQLVRFTALWEPSPDFDLTARIEYGNQDIKGGVTVSDSATLAPRLRQDRFLEDAALGEEGIRGETLIASATANLQLGDYTLTSITGYSWYDSAMVNGFDQTLPNPPGGVTTNSTYNSYPENFDQFSQEIRLASPAGQPIEFIVGAYYDTSDYHLDQFGGFNINNSALTYFGLLHTFFDQQTESYSAFGQATWNATEALRFIGSLRYTRTMKEATFDGERIYGPYNLRPLTQAQGKRKENNVDPSITAQFDITDDIMVYATYGRGSKSGGFVSNTYGTTDATFQYEPEKSRNIEGGVRAQFGAITANVSVYDTKFSNLQVSVYNPTTSTYQTGNAASAASTGIEGTFTLKPSRNFDVTTSLAYQDIRYLDYPGAACLASQPVSECNPASPASIAANNIAGSPLPYVSDFSGSIQAHSWVPISSALELDVTGVVSFRSGYFNSDTQDPVFGRQSGYAKVDLRVQLGDPDDRWHLAFVGRNLTNKLTAGSVFRLPFPITNTTRSIHYLEPARSLAIEAGVKF
ncbi:MAG: TonB-dependent receptor [Sphingopyxis sp.]|uniref:TonB-dependent receptor n=1 Tax=Sphingopyxis sp. TaxID=1908224 RepID=UPI003D8112CD